jgi:hypothetical protein
MTGIPPESLSTESRLNMLFVAGDELPRAIEPRLDRIEMAKALVGHARRHFEYFQAHTDQLLARKNPTTGGIEVTIRRAMPLTSEGELTLEMEVKHCVEDLRSALEYLAMEVYEECCCLDETGREDHIHREVTFPIPSLGMSAEEYLSKVRGTFPNLQTTSTEVFALLAACHRFAHGNEVWLDTLHSAWSELKHRRLGRASKPMKVVVAGMNLANAPSVDVFYFPGTTRAIDPNLGAAFREIEPLVTAVGASLRSKRPPRPTG